MKKTFSLILIAGIFIFIGCGSADTSGDVAIVPSSDPEAVLELSEIETAPYILSEKELQAIDPPEFDVTEIEVIQMGDIKQVETEVFYLPHEEDQVLEKSHATGWLNTAEFILQDEMVELDGRNVKFYASAEPIEWLNTEFKIEVYIDADRDEVINILYHTGSRPGLSELTVNYLADTYGEVFRESDDEEESDMQSWILNTQNEESISISLTDAQGFMLSISFL